MVQVAVKALTAEEIQKQEMEKSLAHCDKMIDEAEEGDDFIRGFWGMVKGTLLSKKSMFGKWNKSVKENRRIEL